GDAVIDAWNRVVAAPDYDSPPRWFHGDLVYLNLLVKDGRLSGVIDWGTSGVGDPAIETTVAWSLFPPDARDAYRDALEIDDATWERGKGWVLTGVFGIPYYRETNPVLVADKITAIEAVDRDRSCSGVVDHERRNPSDPRRSRQREQHVQSSTGGRTPTRRRYRHVHPRRCADPHVGPGAGHGTRRNPRCGRSCADVRGHPGNRRDPPPERPLRPEDRSRRRRRPANAAHCLHRPPTLSARRPRSPVG